MEQQTCVPFYYPFVPLYTSVPGSCADRLRFCWILFLTTDRLCVEHLDELQEQCHSVGRVNLTDPFSYRLFTVHPSVRIVQLVVLKSGRIRIPLFIYLFIYLFR